MAAGSRSASPSATIAAAHNHNVAAPPLAAIRGARGSCAGRAGQATVPALIPPPLARPGRHRHVGPAPALPPGHHTGPMPYAAALVLTVVVEVPVYAIVLTWGLGWSPRRAVLGGLAVNVLTHPFAWWLLSGDGAGYLPRFVLVECGVWVVEAALLCAVARRDFGLLALTALVANSASALAGVGAWWLWG